MEQIAIRQDETVEKSIPLLSYVKAEAQKKTCASMLNEHPSLKVGHSKFSRLNLVVASTSNVGYNYCDLTNHPSIRVSTAQEAMERLRLVVKNDPRLRVVEVSGSGDSLATEETFNLLRIMREEYPYFTTCVATNGLLLPKKLAELEDLGIRAIKVTVNAVDSEVGAKICSFIRLNGKTLHGEEAFEVLSINQLEGLRNAADAGLTVKVDAVCIPGVNSEHLVEVARIVRSLGACAVDIVPFNPSGSFADLAAPSPMELRRVRNECENVCTSEVHLQTSPSFGCISAGM